MKNIFSTKDDEQGYYFKTLMTGLVFCIIFWITETLTQVYIFHSGSVFLQLFPPDSREIYRRILITILLFLCNLSLAYFLKQKANYFNSSTFHYDLLNAIGYAALITNEENKIVYINQRYTEVTGYTSEEALGKNPNILNSGKQNKAFYKQLWDTLHSAGYWEGEMWNRRKSGELFPEWINISVVKHNKHFHYIALFSDITLKKEREERVAHYAYYDPLTNLPNRRFFIEQLEQAITLSKRNKQKMAVLFIDFDKFKKINDQFGHAIGDIYLCEVANLMKSQLRESDIISRFGGDEFVVQLLDIKSKKTALEFIKLLSSEIKLTMIQIEGHQLPVSASIGCAIYPDDGMDAKSLILHADDRMYEVKEKKNRSPS